MFIVPGGIVSPEVNFLYSSDSATATSHTFSVPFTDTTNKRIVVSLIWNGLTSDAVALSSVTANGNTLTDLSAPHSTTYSDGSAILTTTTDVTGTQDVVVTFSATCPCYIAVYEVYGSVGDAASTGAWPNDTIGDFIADNYGQAGVPCTAKFGEVIIVATHCTNSSAVPYIGEYEAYEAVTTYGIDSDATYLTNDYTFYSGKLTKPLTGQDISITVNMSYFPQLVYAVFK